jgi:hypothetical protein
MSKYRCEVDISFDKEADAVGFLNLLQDIKDKIFAGKGTEQIPILAKCRYHECYHDETPPKPCGDYINYDFKVAEKQEIKTKEGVKVTAEQLMTKGEVK